MISARDGPPASMGKGIWDLVSEVLHMFRCRVVWRADTGALYPRACAAMESRCVVIPEDPGDGEDARDETTPQALSAADILRVMQRDLGLDNINVEVDSHRSPSYYEACHGTSVPRIKKVRCFVHT